MRTNILLTALVLLSFSITSCEALGSIFKAGMWMGVIIVIIVIALVLWLIRKIR